MTLISVKIELRVLNGKVLTSHCGKNDDYVCDDR